MDVHKLSEFDSLIGLVGDRAIFYNDIDEER